MLFFISGNCVWFPVFNIDSSSTSHAFSSFAGKSFWIEKLVGLAERLQFLKGVAYVEMKVVRI